MAAAATVGWAKRVTPSSFQREMDAEAPRALKVPVGVSPSSFIQSPGTPIDWPSRGIGKSGVMPSPRLITRRASVTGSSS